MRLKQKTIVAIALLTTLALLGLVFVQFHLLRNAVQLKEQAFRENVQDALNKIVDKLETGETVSRVFSLALHASPPGQQGTLKVQALAVSDSTNAPDSVQVTSDVLLLRPPFRIEGNRITYTLPAQQQVNLRIFDALGREDTVLVNATQPAGTYTVAIDSSRYNTGEYFYKFTADSSATVLRFKDGTAGGALPGKLAFEKKEEMVWRVLNRLAPAHRDPLATRLTPATLDSIIAFQLEENGITLDYAYGVLTAPDSMSLATPAQYRKNLLASPFKRRLFPHDLFTPRSDLVLYFPEQRFYLLQQVSAPLAATVILMAIIVFCFVFTLRTVFRQKRFTTQVTDFINNMTHEFKTPIATIALASEALQKPEMAQQPERLLRYGRIIHDENLRMRHQVDKILQMAILEEGDFELHLAPVAVNKIVAQAVENIALQVESRQGRIECRLEAEPDVIAADAVHLANIVHNLLENANKYSPEAPRLRVATHNQEGGILLEIADQGIGIRPEDQRMVFEKYYRVHTGNRHDVKGFGLGLSYVKLLVAAHGGRVTLESELHRGTTIRVFLPCQPGGRGREGAANRK